MQALSRNPTLPPFERSETENRTSERSRRKQRRRDADKESRRYDTLGGLDAGGGCELHLLIGTAWQTRNVAELTTPYPSRRTCTTPQRQDRTPLPLPLDRSGLDLSMASPTTLAHKTKNQTPPTTQSRFNSQPTRALLACHATSPTDER